MSFSAPASIPQISYASYASPAHSSSYYSPSAYSPSSPYSPSSTYSPSAYSSSQYSSPAYSSPRNQVSARPLPASSRSAQENATFNIEHVSLRTQLRSILDSGRLSKMPVGFPFHCSPAQGMTGKHDSAFAISYSSYEFPEYVYLDSRSQPLCAVFSYTAPSYDSHSKGSSSRMMTWRISAPSREPTHPRQPSSSEFHDSHSFITH